MKKEILTCASENKISAMGFVKADIFSEALPALSKDVPFVPSDAGQRINPFNIMENAKTIIVFICSYNNKMRGNISSYAMGLDYHKVMEQKAEPIIALLNEKGLEAKFFCDDAALDERYLAYKAGLGFIGKNGFLINPTFGSFIFISHIITNAVIPPDEPINQKCLSCGKCLKNCPSGALSSGDFFSCASYLTQKKGELTKNEEEIILKSGFCWGCDICQLVCPHNSKVPLSEIPEFTENLIVNITSLPDSNREFKRKFADRAFSWRGKAVIERNLKILAAK